MYLVKNIFTGAYDLHHFFMDYNIMYWYYNYDDENFERVLGMIVEYIGYHGTSKENARIILCNNFKTREAIWFGEGVYFYLNDEKYANNWAVKRYNTKATVLKAVIKLEDHEVFDLTSPFNEDVKKFHALRRKQISKRFVIHDKEPKHRRFAHDELVLNFLFLHMNIKLFLVNTYSYQKYDSSKSEKLKLSSRVPNGTEMIVKDIDIIISTKEVQRNETEL